MIIVGQSSVSELSLLPILILWFVIKSTIVHEQAVYMMIGYVPTINTMAVVAKRKINAFCLSPLVAAKYITIKTSSSTDATDCDVVSPNILFPRLQQLLWILQGQFQLHSHCTITSPAPTKQSQNIQFLISIQYFQIISRNHPLILVNQFPQLNQYFAMLRSMKPGSLGRLIRQFTVVKPTKYVNIKIQYEGEVTPFSFPLHTKLAKNLEKAGVPLEFQCGFGCSCGTCAVKFSKQDFQTVTKDQPIGEKQRKVLLQSTTSQGLRLSCQLFIMEYFEGMTLKIE